MSHPLQDVTKVIARIGDDPRPQTFAGRFAWMLHELIEVGPRGLTSLERPAPRISHYVHILRRRGVHITMEEENHAGSFKGWHGRYKLAVPVTVLEIERGGNGRRTAAQARRAA